MDKQYVSETAWRFSSKLLASNVLSSPGLKLLMVLKIALKNGSLLLWYTPLFPWITEMPLSLAGPQLFPYIQWSGR